MNTTPYIGCDYAQDRLESFVDGELSVEEQVAVESHVRWCQTCSARIEDLNLIGASVRAGSQALQGTGHSEPDLNAVTSSVLMRMDAERGQSFLVRVREQFSDMRLLWPALGATVAVVLCASVAAEVLKRALIEYPESVAMRLDAMANPGSEMNPLRPDNNAYVHPFFGKFVDSDRAGGISMPRVLDDGFFEGIEDREAMFTMATVVGRDGRIANAELLVSERNGSAERALHASDVAVLDAVRQSRLTPAQTPVGRAVAVNMVWLFVVTTVQTPDAQPAGRAAPVTARARRLPAVDAVAPVPLNQRSARTSHTPTA
ncbi:MAG TPA: zf-HC2 domain-containing protein [Vicinamibacterales bacterium]|nr:zf-HC2 domain-containing protein [Vicinamibacterales bacterium]